MLPWPRRRYLTCTTLWSRRSFHGHCRWRVIDTCKLQLLCAIADHAGLAHMTFVRESVFAMPQCFSSRSPISCAFWSLHAVTETLSGQLQVQSATSQQRGWALSHGMPELAKIWESSQISWARVSSFVESFTSPSARTCARLRVLLHRPES